MKSKVVMIPSPTIEAAKKKTTADLFSHSQLPVVFVVLILLSICAVSVVVFDRSGP